VYQASEIITGLYKSVGWRQPTEIGWDILDADNLVSGSGLIFQDGHPMNTVKHVKYCVSDSSISDANFNTYLDNLQKAAILKVMNAVFKVGSDLIESRLLFDNENINTNALDNATDFVGYEIQTSRCKDITVQIKSLISSFDAVDTFDVYLFHSSKSSPLKTYELTTVENDDTVSALTDWILYFSKTYVGGKFYVGYLTDGLTPKALNREYNNAGKQNVMNCASFTPFKVTGHNSATLWDLEDMEYTDKTYGLNFDVSSHRDYTSAILDNKSDFATAIQLQLCADVLSMIYNSDRSNLFERITKEQVFFELNGNAYNTNFPISKGLYNRLGKEIKDLTKNFTSKPKIQQFTSR